MSSAIVSWTLPTTRSDGTPLAPADIANVMIFDSLAPKPAIPIATVTDMTVLTFTVQNVDVGTHVFSLQCTDTAGSVSAVSNTISFTVTAVAPPSAPVLVSVAAGP